MALLPAALSGASPLILRALSVIGAALVLCGTLALYKWRRTAQRKLRELKIEAPSLLAMKRVRPVVTDTDGGVGIKSRSLVGGFDGDSSGREDRDVHASSSMARDLNLAPGYAERMLGCDRAGGGGDTDRDRSRSSGSNGRGIAVMSLGQYLSSLRPASAGARAASAKDIEMLLGAALLRLFGPTLGTALLPVLGVLPNIVGKAAGLGGVAVAAAAVGAPGTEEENVANGAGGGGGRKRAKDRTVAEHVAHTPSGIVRAVGGMSLLGAAGAADLAAAVARARRGWDGGFRRGGGGGRSSEGKADKAKGRHIAAADEVDATEGDGEESGQEEDGTDQVAEPTAPPSGPISTMRRGEAGATFPPNLIPNPFTLPTDWDRAISGMEEIIEKEQGSYDPDEHPLGETTPVRDALLPDLHMGVGGIRKTHTNREVLANRLLSVLLNKLSTNDILDEVTHHEDGRGCPAKPFAIKIDPEDGSHDDEKLIYRPEGLIEGLIESGHDVEASVTTRITTFGLRLCVKEEDQDREERDDSEGDTARTPPPSSPRYTQIPLGISLRSGLQEPKTGRSISTFLTHGGLDLSVRGGGKGGRLINCDNVLLQYYHQDQGFDGWASGHYPNAPWMFDPTGSRTLDDPVRAVRLAGLLSCCENSVGDRFDLPLGGYGLTGVCNDSAAAVEMAAAGRTGVYPILGIGGYKCHVVRRAEELEERLLERRREHGRKIVEELDGAAAATDGDCGDGGRPLPPPPSVEVAEDARRLRAALRDLPNDVHPTPATEADTARRILESCVPENPPFELLEEERDILRAMANEKTIK